MNERRPQCLGLLGWLFGHSFADPMDGYVIRTAEGAPVCRRCGLVVKDSRSRAEADRCLEDAQNAGK